MLSHDEVLRYSKNIKLDGIGGEGQTKLLQSKVLIIGVGALGLTCAGILAANGVGTIGLVDYDVVDISNIHRQFLYTSQQVGQPKVSAAKENLLKINSYINVIVKNIRAGEQNLCDLVEKYDIIVDGTDNLDSHFVINDVCYNEGKKYVQAGVVGYEGFVFSVVPPKSHCYRCMYPEQSVGNNPYCSNEGVFGPLVNLLGTFQASETIKLILGMENVLHERVLTIDLFNNSFKEIEMPKNKYCPLCGNMNNEEIQCQI